MDQDVRKDIESLLQEIRRVPTRKTFDELAQALEEHKQGCGRLAAARLFKIAGVEYDADWSRPVQ